MRSGIPQTSLNNFSQKIDSNSMEEDQFQKRKIVQSPCVSSRGLPQSPLSSKSGEHLNVSIEPELVIVTSELVSSQKEKSTVASIPRVGGSTSLICSSKDSMQCMYQAQAAAKCRSVSLPKIPAISIVGSPATISPAFSKIEMLTMRYQLNCKKNKVYEYPIRKPYTCSTQQLGLHLSSDSNNDNVKDEMCNMPFSKSLLGGNMNEMAFNLFPKARTRAIMSERPNSDAVAMHIGEIEAAEYLASVDYLPTLPNSFELISRGRSCPAKTSERDDSSTFQSNAPGIPPTSAAAGMKQYSEGVSR
ncbi:unnamed protein product [Fraxinus pennsylvanica]|uniref:PHL domain-containing protein n=1 Tax=Fraxinus pennsylvanica TaxID=56036 RepID=A0AAD1ZCB8_9LAMI|nr:unnamed protein product [Fraxinus pennsylvanica]